MKPIEMPRNSPIGFVIAFFAVITGFSLIWHIWWTGDPRPSRDLGHGPGVRLEREPRARNPGRRDGANGAGAPRPRAPGMTIATIERGSTRAGARAGRRRTGLDADRRRLRVLDLHPQRHHHVLGAVRRLCGAVGPDRRRTDRGRAVQSPPRLHRDHVPLGFELYLRARGIVGRTAAAGALSGLCRIHFRARRGLSFHRDHRILPAWWRQGAGPSRSAFLSAFFTLGRACTARM